VNYGDPRLRDRLAAEYVLGTLQGRARQRFARLLHADADIRNSVRDWEARLLPFAEHLPPVKPPERVWRTIQARLFPQEKRGAFASLAWWRGLALAASLAVLALGTLLILQRETPAPQNYVALLSDDQSRPVLYATAERNGRWLDVRALGPIALPAGRSLELWALPQQGGPRSLGLVAPRGTTRLELRTEADAALTSVPAMAISIEPPGGSPTGAPTGPVVYKGSVLKLW
jgi:anti-sigma-K factor RskA